MAGRKVERETERLHVRIAHSGLCSRRAAEQLIIEGRVQVNGDYVRELGVQVGPEDEVRVDGQLITTAKIYTVVMNKPIGVVTTLSDPQGRMTIARFLPDYGVQLKPVGRLDMDTDGLLLVTNDGDLALRLAHPRYGIEKEYQAIIEGIPSDSTLNKLEKGVFVEGRKTAPAKVEIVHVEERKGTTSIRLTIHEGRKRQVRLMCLTVGHPVIKLTRVRLGSLHLKGMRPGEVRLLGQKEVDQLRTMVGLPTSEGAGISRNPGGARSGDGSRSDRRAKETLADAGESGGFVPAKVREDLPDEAPAEISAGVSPEIAEAHGEFIPVLPSEPSAVESSHEVDRPVENEVPIEEPTPAENSNSHEQPGEKPGEKPGEN